MADPTSTEKNPARATPPCPLLPAPEEKMSFRNLRVEHETGEHREKAVFQAACTYANYLWTIKLPARAILALCRAIYLDPDKLGEPFRQPYRALAWFLRHYAGDGFLGNPRVSFIHQATRMPCDQFLERQRAWAMWYISKTAIPSLPPDPMVAENPPERNALRIYLDQYGLPEEGREWEAAMELARPTIDQEAGSGFPETESSAPADSSSGD
ncbi:hypothetical protein G0Q06_02655 [Puniceicoccales bacterium CK1056]|uniref:Uncharacterized protein n=1 Tax=Oceanipulchritudo coccoides TaxID=2706888 RepID=A0A6B2LXM5_9BACT|nr:hypothetical protein [Oceanipulchritudo coccoides]NDV61348.1 hypothetical protein [Oceanipulchritudo coccoides]